MKTSSLPQSKGDSLFGMALAQAFMGMAFGPCAEQVWEAAENVSAVYEDRCSKKKAANGPNAFQLGEKKTLGGTFARMAEQTIAEMERVTLQTFLKPEIRAFAI